THQQLLNNTLLKIKKDLAYLQLELRACVNQHDGMVYYGVVNNISIGLGIRWFILDLRSWFRGNDIPSCAVCNEACIKASSCLNEGCNLRIHEYCLKKKFPQRK
ncbi:hypothetical protein ACJX0J_013112, partial [Zea mays]